MKQKTKSALVYIFQPSAVVFYIALFNFISFWIESHRMGGIACVVCPWFYPWSYNNEPSIILAASTFLLFKRWWSYVISVALSGYLIGSLLYLLMSIDMPLCEAFKIWLNSPNNILTEGETQYLLALIIFSFAVFYLGRIYYIKITRQIYP